MSLMATCAPFIEACNLLSQIPLETPDNRSEVPSIEGDEYLQLVAPSEAPEASTSAVDASLAGQGPANGEKWGEGPRVRLSKSEMKKRRRATTGSKWFDMPAAPEMTPELRREFDAMRLRNAIDPKRFMKGSARIRDVPEFMQMGHVIDDNNRATTAEAPKLRRKSFVDELGDMEDYTRTKYLDDVMRPNMSGRRKSKKQRRR